MASRWSLARWRQYSLCPRSYRYRYLDSIRKYDADASFFDAALYARRHFHQVPFLFHEALCKALPYYFREGHKSNRVIKVFEKPFYKGLMDYPEVDRAGIEKECLSKFEEFLQSLKSDAHFTEVSASCAETCEHVAEFQKFSIDGADLDLYVDLMWRSSEALNFLVIRRSQFVKPLDLALLALYAVKQFGVDVGKLGFWSLVCEPKVHLSREEINLDSLYELRELIQETAPLLNSSENDFPFTKDMASCDSCNFRSMCERFEERGVGVD